MPDPKIELQWVNGSPIGPVQARFYRMTPEQFYALPEDQQLALLNAVEAEQQQIAIQTADTSAPEKPPSQDERIGSTLAGTGATIGGVYLANQLMGSGATATAPATPVIVNGASSALAGSGASAAGGAAASAAPAAPVIVNGASAAGSTTSAAAPSLLGTAGNALGLAGQAYGYYASGRQAYEDLKSKDPHTRDMGAIEAAALASGPTFAWAAPLVKPVDNMFRTKHPGQQKRDAMRDVLDREKQVVKKDGKWYLQRPDGTLYDIGTEDRSRTDGYEIKDFDAEGVGETVAWADPLAEILSGGDQGLREQTSGYLTHYAMGSGDRKQNMIDRYQKLGYDRDKIFASIDEMERMGRIQKDRADAYRNSMNTLWGTGAGTPSASTAPNAAEAMRPVGGGTSSVPQGGRGPRMIPGKEPERSVGMKMIRTDSTARPMDSGAATRMVAGVAGTPAPVPPMQAGAKKPRTTLEQVRAAYEAMSPGGEAVGGAPTDMAIPATAAASPIPGKKPRAIQMRGTPARVQTALMQKIPQKAPKIDPAMLQEMVRYLA